MSEDYYKTLNVSKTASTEQIKKAYREMARKCHPDMNPDDPSAKGRFQKLQEAYDVVGNPEKRKFYDQFGVDPNSGPQGPQGPQSWESSGGWPGSGPFNFSGGGEAQNIDDILRMFTGGFGGDASEEMFGTRSGGRRPRRRATQAPMKGDDLEQRISVPFVTAVSGGIFMLQKRFGSKDETIEVKIPAGIENGKKIRLRGQGKLGSQGGENGDLLLEIHAEEHPFFERKGNDLHVKLPISLKEAVLGASVDVPTPQGVRSLKIPPNSGARKKLRMKGCGVPIPGKAGDLIVEFAVMLPSEWSEEDKKAIRLLKTELKENPRSELRWG